MVFINRANEPTVTIGQMNLLFNIRSLWRDLATWSRAYMVNRTAGLPISNEVFNRWYRIPTEFGSLLQYFIGRDNAARFVQLLSQQIVLFRSILEAQLSGDQNLVNQLVQQTYELADERAAFMNSVSPFWDETEFRNLLYMFLQYNLEEMTAILSKDYTKDIDIYDRIIHHADNIGDYFTQGLINYLTYGRQ